MLRRSSVVLLLVSDNGAILMPFPMRPGFIESTDSDKASTLISAEQRESLIRFIATETIVVYSPISASRKWFKAETLLLWRNKAVAYMIKVGDVKYREP